MNKNEGNILVQRLKQGDQAAFTVIFSHYYADLVLFANTFMRDIPLAEEIVQDVFLKLWENRESIVIALSLKSFLLKTIQNKCIDRIRHMKVRDRYLENINEHQALFENDADNYLLFSELQRDFDKALEKLPNDVKQTFCLHRIEGCTYPEIADKLGISVRTVEVRISKALFLLREQLKDYLITLLTLLLLK
jgi:RNA polymerase sigma-70 factor (family 1)